MSASFYPTPAPIRSDLLSYQLRFMAVDADVQGRGYGARVLDVAESALAEVEPSSCGPTRATPRSVSTSKRDGR